MFVDQLGHAPLSAAHNGARQRQRRPGRRIARHDKFPRQFNHLAQGVGLRFQPGHAPGIDFPEAGRVFRSGSQFSHQMIQIALHCQQDFGALRRPAARPGHPTGSRSFINCANSFRDGMVLGYPPFA